MKKLEKEKFVIADADGNNKLEGEELVQMYGHGMSDKAIERFCGPFSAVLGQGQGF